MKNSYRHSADGKTYITLNNNQVCMIDTADFPVTETFRGLLGFYGTTVQFTEYNPSTQRTRNVSFARLLLGLNRNDGKKITFIDGDVLNCCRNNFRYRTRPKLQKTIQHAIAPIRIQLPQLKPLPPIKFPKAKPKPPTVPLQRAPLFEREPPAHYGIRQQNDGWTVTLGTRIATFETKEAALWARLNYDATKKSERDLHETDL